MIKTKKITENIRYVLMNSLIACKQAYMREHHDNSIIRVLILHSKTNCTIRLVSMNNKSPRLMTGMNFKHVSMTQFYAIICNEGKPIFSFISK